MEQSTVTAESASKQNGHGTAKTIEVTNPATGAHVATVPALTPRGVTEAVERARAAQPAWEAARLRRAAAASCADARSGSLDNSERIIDTIVAENGKTYEDAQLAEVSYAASAFGFWAKNAPEFLADEKVRSASPFVLGRKLVVRYAPVGVVGVIGPWNYPLTNSFGDCIPALAAGNSVVLKPATLTPMTSLLMAEGLRECGAPRGRLPGRGRRGLDDRQRADRRGRLRHVHRLDRGRQEGRRSAPPRRSPARPWSSAARTR